MKILLTGATGFIGKSLGLELFKLGHDLHVFTRNAKEAQIQLPFKAKIFEWKNTSKAPDPKALEGVEAVIHLAGESIFSKRWSEQQKKIIAQSRIDSTQQLCKSITENKNHRIHTCIFASAIGYYGDRKDEELNEQSTAGKGFLADICKEWEKASEIIEKQNIRRVLMRVGLVLGRGGLLQELFPLFQKHLGAVLGDGRHWMSWIHIEDLIQLFLFALKEKNVSGPINAVSQTHRNEEFTKILSEVLNKKNNLLSPPSFLLKTLLGEKSEAILSSQKISRDYTQKCGFTFSYHDLKQALITLWDRESEDSEFFTQQYFDLPLPKVFEFFSEAKNLERITPPWIDFKILKCSTAHIEQGSIFEYALKIHSMPARWVSLIKDFRKDDFFSDFQLKGPYKKWFHTHEFESVRGGTLMTDRVLYQLPMGWVGNLVGASWIKNEVDKIFAYRRTRILELLS